MADIMSREKRSSVMSRIRGKDTGPELALRRELWAAGVRGYRLRPSLPGKPDIAFMGKKVAVFVDGCFWHGCPVCYKKPASNQAFWRKKLQDNTARDRRVDRILRSTGWKTMRFWEHEVMTDVSAVAVQIRREIDDGKRLLGGGGRHKVRTDT